MKASLHHIEPLTRNIKTFWFQPEKPLRFTAGQYTELYLPHANPDDRDQKRWLTISSSPHDELFSITTKFSARRGSTFKKRLNKLRPGDEVAIAEAMGDFVLPKLIQTPLVFVAGGIGITPFHSMLSWLAESGEHRPIQFIYAVRNEEEIIFQNTFDKAGVHVTIVVGEPSPEWGGERGNLSAEMILGITKPSNDTLIYMSGPEPMIKAIKEDMIVAGVDNAHIVRDYFPGYENV
jgi:ferredoxin-NADP reductase